MGIPLWLASGIAAWALARIVPPGRRPGWLAELILSVLTALLLGAVATAMDFGGWQEPDWRAVVFAGVGALGTIGVWRALSARQ
ncbi:MAG TPA: hypothetical protein VEK57_06225 [Thermoanaerobaculia bacterium]|nr:hypothetical protein [Thermoanaerobaculia bacterium]